MLSSVCANMHAVLHKHTYATTPSAVPSVDCPATAAAHGVAHQLPCNGPGKSSSAGWQAAALPMALGHVALWGEGGGGGGSYHAPHQHCWRERQVQTRCPRLDAFHTARTIRSGHQCWQQCAQDRGDPLLEQQPQQHCAVQEPPAEAHVLWGTWCCGGTPGAVEPSHQGWLGGLQNTCRQAGRPTILNAHLLHHNQGLQDAVPDPTAMLCTWAHPHQHMHMMHCACLPGAQGHIC
jgi:hypothetical protein